MHLLSKTENLQQIEEWNTLCRSSAGQRNISIELPSNDGSDVRSSGTSVSECLRLCLGYRKDCGISSTVPSCLEFSSNTRRQDTSFIPTPRRNTQVQVGHIKHSSVCKCTSRQQAGFSSGGSKQHRVVTYDKPSAYHIWIVQGGCHTLPRKSNDGSSIEIFLCPSASRPSFPYDVIEQQSFLTALTCPDVSPSRNTHITNSARSHLQCFTLQPSCPCWVFLVFTFFLDLQMHTERKRIPNSDSR